MSIKQPKINFKEQFENALIKESMHGFPASGMESNLIKTLSGATQMYGRCHHDNFGKTVRKTKVEKPGLFAQFTSAVQDALLAQEADKVGFSGKPSQLIANIEGKMAAYNRDHRDFTKCCKSHKLNDKELIVNENQQQLLNPSLKA